MGHLHSCLCVSVAKHWPSFLKLSFQDVDLENRLGSSRQCLHPEQTQACLLSWMNSMSLHVLTRVPAPLAALQGLAFRFSTHQLTMSPFLVTCSLSSGTALSVVMFLKSFVHTSNAQWKNPLRWCTNTCNSVISN